VHTSAPTEHLVRSKYGFQYGFDHGYELVTVGTAAPDCKQFTQEWALHEVSDRLIRQAADQLIMS
jgi:hypothetical protein